MRVSWLLGLLGSLGSLVSVAAFFAQVPALQDENRPENIVAVLGVLYLLVAVLPAALGLRGAWRAALLGKGGVLTTIAAAIVLAYAAVPVYNQAYGWAVFLAAPAFFYVAAWVGRPRRQAEGVGA